MRIAVTGANGFLGKALVSKLSENDEHCIIAMSSNKQVLQELWDGKNIEVVARDDFSALKKNHIDVLVNCAFPRTENGLEMAKGLTYTKELFEAAVDASVPNIVNISSQSVYSQSKSNEALESDAPNPGSIYAVGKLAGELLNNSICKHLNHTNIRMASLIGPCFDQRVVNKLIKKAIDTGSINVLDGNLKYGFMDIDDAVAGLLSVFNYCDKNYQETYNFGGVNGYSLIDIANEISIVLRKYKIDINIETVKTDKVFNSTINSDRFSQDFGFKAKTELGCTIEKILKTM